MTETKAGFNRSGTLPDNFSSMEKGRLHGT